MDLSMEQRLAIKFCFKAGKSAMETLQMVNAAYGDQALSHSNVFRRYGRFRDGREDTEDGPRNGRLTECRNDNSVEKISQLLLQNRHLSLRMLADEVNIGKDTVRKIVVEDLRKRKICSRFVPHSLTPEQKDQRIAACWDLIATADRDPDFFKKIVTGDKTWRFAYDPTTKRQSTVWVGETSPRPKKNSITSEVSCEDHVGGFLRLARRNPQRICSGGSNYQCSVLQRCNGKAPKQNSTC